MDDEESLLLSDKLLGKDFPRHGIKCQCNPAGLLFSPEDFPYFTREREWDLIANTIPSPAVRNHQARYRRERVGVIGNDPQRISVDQHRHRALSHQANQVCKEECSTATTDLYPPVGPGPASVRPLLEEDSSAQLHEQLDSMQRVRLSLCMPVVFGMGMQARSCLPQGGCPPLERCMCLRPVIALL